MLPNKTSFCTKNNHLYIYKSDAKPEGFIAPEFVFSGRDHRQHFKHFLLFVKNCTEALFLKTNMKLNVCEVFLKSSVGTNRLRALKSTQLNFIYRKYLNQQEEMLQSHQ